MKVNQRIKSLLGSTTLAITAKAKELKAKGVDVVNFGAGEPDFDTPDFIKKAAIDAIDKGFTKYTPSVGTLELREAVSQKFKKDNHLDYAINQIVVSCGAKHSLYGLIQVMVDEGDEVILPSPFWVSYPEMVKLSGASCKILETSAQNNFKITADQLNKAVSARTRLLILNSPSNPTGSVYSKKELEGIAEICVKNNIYVISDEIYEKLIYDSDEYTSIASFGKEIYNLTATVNGVSKAYSMTGWRIGYCGAPSEIIGYVQKFQDHTTSNPASISQMAALAALKAPPESVTAMCREFKKRRDIMMQCLDKIPQVSYVRPQGAFYVFCDVSRLKMKCAVAAERILTEANVAVIPGDGFGAEGYIRLSFATSVERIQEGVQRIGAWVNKNTK
ncbi:MAG TPA: pyridoxal phosphate-dependent aminotransferase [Candidatus Omnitrophota bacterium]|nr:pyridoxal phosphate-dependent aminotransferase [Candidatus Omnitrophota bacterium]HPD83937.1 pyridoxal phosphate-dependent aminotransferase [Candidatus Omnitrophota bacterium]HRZ02794.1 pyridoxal phosphate-dependent aminotransferase [Candidatus Omnitrophota bacterium]